MKFVCNKLPWGIKWACKKAVGRYFGKISDAFEYAGRNGRCVYLGITWGGFVRGVYHYRCNWR